MARKKTAPKKRLYSVALDRADGAIIEQTAERNQWSLAQAMRHFIRLGIKKGG